MDQETLNKLASIPADELVERPEWSKDFGFLLSQFKKSKITASIADIYNLPTDKRGWGKEKVNRFSIVKSLIEDLSCEIINDYENRFALKGEQLEIFNRLKDIPFSEYKYFVQEMIARGENEDQFLPINTYDVLEFQNMGDFYLFDADKFAKIPGMGKTKKIKFIKEKDILVQNLDFLDEQWSDFNTHVCIPQCNIDNMSYFDILRTAFTELLDLLSSREHKIHYNIKSQKVRTEKKYFMLKLFLDKFFLNGGSLKDMTEFSDLTAEGCRQKAEAILQIFTKEGNLSKFFPNWGNVSVREILKAGQNINQVCLFQPIQFMIDNYGVMPENLYNFFSLETVEVFGKHYVIPYDSLGTYSHIALALEKSLREFCTNPMSKEELTAQTNFYLTQYKRYHGEPYDVTFINCILNNEEFVEKQDGLFLIKHHLLETNIQKLTRIIYDAKEPISREKVYETFSERYPGEDRPETSLANLGDSINYSNGCWYFGESKISFQKRIKQFAEDRVIFYWNELQESLIGEGYPWDVEKETSYRAYVTPFCTVDNNDDKHFCLKDSTSLYSEFSWRQPQAIGIVNWIFKKLRDFMGDEEEVNDSDFRKFLEETKDESPFAGMNIKQRVANCINMIFTETSPFVKDGPTIRKNHPVFENTDFEYVGLKGGKYPYFVQIRAIAANEIKKVENGRIKLVDFVKLANSLLEEEQTRNTIIKALENTKLPPIPVRLDNIDNGKYLIYNGEAVSSEPVYKVEIINNKESVEVIETNTRQNISYNMNFAWDALKVSMLSDLGYSSKHFLDAGLVLNEAVDAFISHLQKQENANLNTILPTNLYEYWNANTDIFDRITYINNLCLFFNALLKSLNISSTTSSESEYFSNIKLDLLDKRSKCIDGEALNLNSIQVALTICNFVSLYVYVVAKNSNN